MSPSADLLAWTHQARADLPPVVLLHGSGQDENALLAFARAACPGHTLTAVRGRIPWEGGYAFFRRRPDRTLDEADLAKGAAAVQRLLSRLLNKTQQLPLLVGYSNGAIAARRPRSSATRTCQRGQSCCGHSRPSRSEHCRAWTATQPCWCPGRTTHDGTLLTGPRSTGSFEQQER